jgi:hypothetical protein
LVGREEGDDVSHAVERAKAKGLISQTQYLGT